MMAESRISRFLDSSTINVQCCLNSNLTLNSSSYICMDRRNKHNSSVNAIGMESCGQRDVVGHET